MEGPSNHTEGISQLVEEVSRVTTAAEARRNDLVDVLTRHLKEELADRENRQLFDEAGLTIRETYLDLKRRRLAVWVHESYHAWDGLCEARRDLENARRASKPAASGATRLVRLLSALAPAAAAASLTTSVVPLLVVTVLTLIGAGAAFTLLDSGDPSPPDARRVAIEELRVQRLESLFERIALEQCIRPDLRELLNAAKTRSRGRVLSIRADGLAELTDSRYEIATSAKAQLKQILDGMPGGSIGLAGPRGVGKTTLMRGLCDAPDGAARRVAAMLPAPVVYDARDFLLTLLARLCRAVLPPESAEHELPADPAVASTQRPADLLWRIAGPLSLVLLLAALAIVVIDRFLADVRPSTLIAVGLGLLGYALLIFWLLPGLRARIQKGSFDTREQEPPDELQLLAAALLREVRFQQSYSSGYAGSLKLPVGVEATASSSLELASKQKSFPELVDQLRGFLELVARKRGGVFVGIDELDKIESVERAQEFLNEIKTIFGVRGCFYFVAVSDEALSSFERRGLPFRDVFDSSFDDVLVVEPLSFSESERLLRRRVVGLSLPYVALCHAMSGGLARDLIRVARRLVEIQARNEAPVQLEAAISELVIDDVARKAHAIIPALAVELRGSPSLAPLLWTRELATGEVSVERLCEHLGGLPVLPRDGQGRSLVLDLATFAYFVATLSEIFGNIIDDCSDDSYQDASRALAEIRAAFATSSSLSWRLLDALRERTPGLSAVALSNTPHGQPLGAATQN